MPTKVRTFADCETTIDAEAVAAELERPLQAEMADIEQQMIALNDRKRELHRAIEAIEAESATRRRELRDPNAGPDQVMYPAGQSLTPAEVEAMRIIVAQHERV